MTHRTLPGLRPPPSSNGGWQGLPRRGVNELAGQPLLGPGRGTRYLPFGQWEGAHVATPSGPGLLLRAVTGTVTPSQEERGAHSPLVLLSGALLGEGETDRQTDPEGWVGVRKHRHGKSGRETKGETQREAQTESCACNHMRAALPASLPSCVELVID